MNLEELASARRAEDARSLELKPFAEALGLAQSGVSLLAREVLKGKLQGGAHLQEAMLYALDGGKALRAFLVFESARLHGISRRAAAFPALAIECVHAYSLIHDDLPCMDDDDLRRGKPTVHRKWDEHTAVLAGDALQTLGFELLTQPSEFSDAVVMRLVRKLAKASGHKGMVGGQVLDIAAETAQEPETLEQIIAIQELKTGKLIEWSAMAGAVLAEADNDPLYTYGKKLGLAFQIADDVLDVEGDAAETGKAVGKDADAGKATFVSLLGLDAAKRRAAGLVEEASDALSSYGEDAECLREAARFVISRRK